MSVQASVIDELRSMFKEGATPSRLMRHIVLRHPQERNWHGLIQQYFFEAFAVPIVRGLTPGDTYEDADLRYAYLNVDVLHEMVQSRTTWDQEAGNSDVESPCWLDSLAATSAIDRLKEAKTANASLDGSEPWNSLAAAGCKGRTEMVQILARLVERLQQQIIAFEQSQPAPSRVECRSPQQQA